MHVLCYYNYFRTEEEKFAISDGNLSDQSKSFVDLFINENTNEKFWQRIASESNIGKDWLYFQKLVQNEWFESMKVLKEKWSISSFFCWGNKNPGSSLWNSSWEENDLKRVLVDNWENTCVRITNNFFFSERDSSGFIRRKMRNVWCFLKRHISQLSIRSFWTDLKDSTTIIYARMSACKVNNRFHVSFSMSDGNLGHTRLKLSKKLPAG